MGRKPEGLKVVWRDGWGYARFTWQKKREFVATGERDPGRAQVEAERIYGEVISGRRRKVSAAVRIAAPLVDLFADWLSTLEGVLDVKTLRTYRRVYVRTHFLGFFRSLDDVADESRLDAYGRTRLRKVLRTSVFKEFGALRGFLRWCKMEGFIDRLPAFPEFPKTVKGKRVGKQRAKANELTEEQVRDAIEALPLISARISKKDRRRFAVRARFIVAYETGLRPATIDVLAIPTHWQPGASELVIPDEDDKTRYGRTLSLSTAAVTAMLETIVALRITRGVIFGEHDYRTYLRKAGGAALVAKLAPYDFRHARGTHMADRGAAMPGIAYQLGHTQLTTTNKYTHATRRAGDAALDVGGALDIGAITDQEPK